LQGFTIVDKYAPFVFINSDDWNAAQLFTMVHELVHIWIGKSGISNQIEPSLEFNDKLHPVELFCNEVTANALMPYELMKNLESSTFNSSYSVFTAAKQLGVSSFALLIRALKMKIISTQRYYNLKKESDKEFQAFIQKEMDRKIK